MKEFRPTGIRGYFLFPEVGLPDVGGGRGLEALTSLVFMYNNLYIFIFKS
jgi:hypothetical protein